MEAAGRGTHRSHSSNDLATLAFKFDVGSRNSRGCQYVYDRRLTVDDDLGGSQGRGWASPCSCTACRIILQVFISTPFDFRYNQTKYHEIRDRLAEVSVRACATRPRKIAKMEVFS